jgi:molybdopterin-biosynthesis enzyme MoeA-like protein
MFFACKKELPTGKKIFSKEITTSLTESIIAKDLTDLQNKYPEVTMGSYPSEQQTSLVFRSTNQDLINKSSSEMIELINVKHSNSIIKIS